MNVYGVPVNAKSRSWGSAGFVGWQGAGRRALAAHPRAAARSGRVARVKTKKNARALLVDRFGFVTPWSLSIPGSSMRVHGPH